MSPTTILAPPYLTEDDEFAHPPQPVANWSENYLSQAYAPDTRIGIYLHRSRTPFDPGLWREIVAVYLPDDQLLVAKGFRVSEGDGTGLTFRCDEPWRAWTKQFRGAGRLLPVSTLRAGPMCDGPHTGLELDLTYRAMSPAWDLGSGQRDQVWARAHYEQACRVSGTLRIGGALITLEGTGLRDHSWGPRDLSAMGRHVWLHGQFPSGRAFMVVGVRTLADQEALTHAVITDETGVESVAVQGDLPFVGSLDAAGGGYELELDTSSGCVTVTADVLHTLPFTFAGANEMVVGLTPIPRSTHVCIDAQTRFRWNGEVGYGLSERSYLLPRERGTR